MITLFFCSYSFFIIISKYILEGRGRWTGRKSSQGLQEKKKKEKKKTNRQQRQGGTVRLKSRKRSTRLDVLHQWNPLFNILRVNRMGRITVQSFISILWNKQQEEIQNKKEKTKDEEAIKHHPTRYSTPRSHSMRSKDTNTQQYEPSTRKTVHIERCNTWRGQTTRTKPHQLRSNYPTNGKAVSQTCRYQPIQWLHSLRQGKASLQHIDHRVISTGSKQAREQIYM